MHAIEMFKTPQVHKIAKPNMNKGLIGKTFKRDAKGIMTALTELGETNPEAALALSKAVNEDGKASFEAASGSVELVKGMVSFKEATKKISSQAYTPNVIEPSFGVGRILYMVLEHSFYVRAGDENNTVMKFAPQIAPVKCSVFPLTHNSDAMDSVVHSVRDKLVAKGISNKIDLSGAPIGRRYARTDQIGIPFAVTVDFQTLDPNHRFNNTVTVRERDSMTQIRVGIDKLSDLIYQLTTGRMLWEEAEKSYEVVYSAAPKLPAPAAAAAASGPLSTSACLRFSRPAVPIV